MAEDTVPEAPPGPHFEDVLAEILQAQEQGQAPDVQGYVERFPQFEQPLREFFRNQQGFARLPPHLAPRRTTAAPNPTLAANARFAGYEVLEELGHGGMGVVYRARQLMAGQEVALKVIRADRLEELP